MGSMQLESSEAGGSIPRTTGTGEPAATTDKGRMAGVALMLVGAMSNQTGASIATFAFPALGPAGVVAVRQWVAAIVLWCIGRPKLRNFTAAQWRLVLGLALVFAAMNLSLYMAIDRIGLGLAVTLEFLGPLSIALIGSRRLVNLLCAVSAAAAVLLLVRPTPSTDYLGIGLALLAAVCWGSYIMLNRAVGASLPGLEGTAAAAGISGMLYLPVGIWVLWHHPPSPAVLGYALVAGILSSAVPFLVDLLALRRVSAHSFGMFMSISPVFAALIGLVVLGERLDSLAWLAIIMIVCANAVVAAVPPRPAA